MPSPRPHRLAALGLALALVAGCSPAATATPAPVPTEAPPTPTELGQAAAAATDLPATVAPTEVPPTEAPPADQEVSWMVHGDPGETAAFQNVADAFEALHPGVQVTLINIATGDADYFARLGSDLVAGTPADVVYMDYRDAGRYYATRSRR